MFRLVEMFTHFDLSVMLHMDMGKLIEALQVPLLSSASQSPGELSSGLCKPLAAFTYPHYRRS